MKLQTNNDQQTVIVRKMNDQPARYQAAIGIGGIIMVALALRPSMVSIGPVLSEIRKTFGLSHTTAGLLTTIPDFLMGLLALPTPWLANKIGRDKLIISAMVILSVSTMIRGFAQNTFVLLLTTAGVGTGIAIAGSLLSGFVKGSFAKQAAFVMGLYSTSLALGSTGSALLTLPIANATGSWRIAIAGYGVIGFLGSLAWFAVVKYHKDNRNISSDKTNPHVSLPWRNARAWKIALYFACVNLLFYALLTWISALYAESGFPIEKADKLLGSFTSAFLIGTPIIGSLSKSRDRRFWLAGCSVLTLTGLLFIMITPAWMPAIVVFLIALGLSGAFTLGMTLPLDNTQTAEETNAWTAFTLTVGYLIAATGPISVGILRDISGNFSNAIILLIFVAGAMLFLAFALKPSPLRD